MRSSRAAGFRAAFERTRRSRWNLQHREDPERRRSEAGAQTRTGADGRFSLPAGTAGKDSTFYLVARGSRPTANKTAEDNPALALMTAVGATPPPKVTINEMTTIATVWTHNQFIDGTAFKGHALGLKIAAGKGEGMVNV